MFDRAYRRRLPMDCTAIDMCCDSACSPPGSRLTYRLTSVACRSLSQLTVPHLTSRLGRPLSLVFLFLLLGPPQRSSPALQGPSVSRSSSLGSTSARPLLQVLSSPSGVSRGSSLDGFRCLYVFFTFISVGR